MVIIIIHVAHITCLVTKHAWHDYGVIGVYKIHHGAGRISYFCRNRQYYRWLVGSWARSGPVTFNGASNTVVSLHGYGRDRGP